MNIKCVSIAAESHGLVPDYGRMFLVQMCEERRWGGGEKEEEEEAALLHL